jgi:hypothetical protein
VEVDDLSSPAGERRLRDARTLDALATSIARGVLRFGDGEGDVEGTLLDASPGGGATPMAWSRRSVYNPGDISWSLIVGPTPNPPRSAGCLRRDTVYADYSGWRSVDPLRMKIEIPSRRFDADLVIGWEANGELPSLPGVFYVKHAWVDVEARSVGAGGVSFGVLAVARWDSTLDLAKVQFEISIAIDDLSGGSPSTIVKRTVEAFGDGSSSMNFTPLPP